jgi:uncharacterized protein YdhG (YjbR/CyaY superfamily)
MSKPKDVDAYIAESAAAARPLLEELRQLIRSAVPEAEEGISWGVPFYKHHGALGGFAAYKDHVSFGFGGDALGGNDRADLEKNGYKLGKQTIRIDFDQAVPTAVLRRVVRVKADMNEAQRADG